MTSEKKKVTKKASPKKEACSNERFETRSPMYLKQMSDDVNARLEEKAEQLNVAKWLVAEKILKSALGIDNGGINVAKWLGINANRARLGKPAKGKLKK